MRALFVGIILFVCGSFCIAFASLWKSEDAPLWSIVVLHVVGALVAMLGTGIAGPALYEMASPKKQKKKRELLDHTEWAAHPIETEQFRAIERIETVQTAVGNTFVQRIKLISKVENDTEAEFAVIRFYDSAYWKFESADQLYARKRKPVSLDEELDSAYIKEILKDCEFVLCVGLASSAEGTPSNANGLSNRRAARLADWVQFSNAMLERGALPVAVPLGQGSTTYEYESREEIAQRTAILIAVHRRNKFISLDRIYDELAIRTHIDGVKLSDFSRPRDGISQFFPTDA